MNKLIYILGALSIVSACGPQPPKVYTAQEVLEICAEERRDAEGIRGDVTVGANTRTGPFTNISISVNDSFLRGEDPEVVYEECIARFVEVSPQSFTASAQ